MGRDDPDCTRAPSLGVAGLALSPYDFWIATLVQIKGHALRSTRTTLAKLHGEEVVRQCLGALPPDIREAYESGLILSGSWYPLRFHIEFHRAARSVLGRGYELTRRLAHAGTSADFKGLYRLAASMLSPETSLQMSGLIWGRYWKGGSLVVGESRAGMAHVVHDGCYGFDRHMWECVIGGSIAVLEASKAHNVRARVVSGVADGSLRSEVQYRWTTGADAAPESEP